MSDKLNHDLKTTETSLDDAQASTADINPAQQQAQSETMDTQPDSSPSSSSQTETTETDRQVFVDNRPSPFKRALRNGALISLVVGAITYFQNQPMESTISSMLLAFVAVTPALWLSYRFTQNLLKKHAASNH